MFSELNFIYIIYGLKMLVLGKLSVFIDIKITIAIPQKLSKIFIQIPHTFYNSKYITRKSYGSHFE